MRLGIVHTDDYARSRQTFQLWKLKTTERALLTRCKVLLRKRMFRGRTIFLLKERVKTIYVAKPHDREVL